ncbi:hypothetical protein BAS10_00450 [Elizabethkingia meningoseptica]|uniref:hypothetical protein n=1 Tax=Elizabethkingia meningoseptica TaxID=238 RepID=UPI0009CC2F65|nr:hypothetical protein [Elizabethkingia meningoseptica]OPC00741.1 hypothetical protein BAS10_00450 [Elizabethkingia meningoseptica]
MRKKILYASLWGIFALSLLSSCRTEDGLTQKQQEKDMRFSVFVSKSGETINYAKGFSYLMQRYDELHQSNLSGINNTTEIRNLNASTDKKALLFSSEESYVEFNISSKVITEENGDKWVVFPKVQGKKVIGFVIASLTEKGTYVSYREIGSSEELFQANYLKFQEVLDSLLNNTIRINSIASVGKEGIVPIADVGQKCFKVDGSWVCFVDGVDLTKPGSGGGGNAGGGGGSAVGGGCPAHRNCLDPNGGGGGDPSTPLDACTRAKGLLSANNVNKAIDYLKKKITDINRTDTNEEIHVINKDGSTKVIHGKEDHVVFSPDIYTQGSVHDHDSKGYPMFPPHDIDTFMNTVRVQNYPPDPKNNIDGSGSAFLGIVTPNYNYFMLYNGTKDDVPPRMDYKMVDDYQGKFGAELFDMKIHGVKITEEILQKKFFEYIDKMGLGGKIDLIKQVGNTNYVVNKNLNGTITNNKPCK